MSDIVDLSPESNGFDDMDADLEDYIGKLLWTFSLTDSFFFGINLLILQTRAQTLKLRAYR